MRTMRSTYYTETPLATITLGAKLGQTLKSGDVVLLYGDLGAGKTHFVKGIAEGLGVTHLVKSPTFTYVNPYPARGDLTLYHYDLYRMQGPTPAGVGQGASDLTSLGYEETLHDSQAIIVVEWADRLGTELPSRYLRVDFLIQENTRSLAFDFVYPSRLRSDKITLYYEEWQTPEHVRAHCQQVTHVSQTLAEAYIQKGELVDINLLYTSCMLHDMTRVCDFRTLDRDQFSEEVTEVKWDKWLELRQRFARRHHADIAYEALAAQGFTETAEAIRLHKSTALIDEWDAFDTLEKKIVYYADKRVKHTEIVSIAERFRDGRERYGDYDSPEEKKRFLEVEKRTLELELLLFKPLDITPDEII